MEEQNIETYAFQAEINQLLSLIINTFYSNKEIFLRELISNASDALDKIRFKSLQDKDLIKDEPNFHINIICDKENNVLSIIDTGIGMTKDELIKNLGTIAQSGTKNFMEALSAGADISMIGQFGVGFYSSYLVANKVVVTSKNTDDEQFIWNSEAGGTFTIEKDNSENKLKRGTRIDLYIKEDQKEFLEINKIKELIKKHNSYINYPISILVEKTVEEEVSDDEDISDDKKLEEIKEEDTDEKKDTDEKEDTDEKDKPEDKDEPVIEDVTEEETKEKKKKKIKKVEKDWEVCNSQKPIWTRKTDEITKDEYTTFYKGLTNDWEEQLAYKHFSVEGQVEFKSLLFIPKRLPNDIFTKNKKQNNIKLFVRRVYITDDSNDLCPEWLSFVKGIVDSEDLPLNISREILQQNKILKVIKKNIVKKVIELLTELSLDKEKYSQFYEQYSKNIKLGIHEDNNNKVKLSKLLRFKSSKSNNEVISFDDYISNMNDEQKEIYYIIGESQEYVNNAPFLEKLKKKDIEVIYMTDPIDEYMMQQLTDFEGKKFVNICKSKLNIDDTEVDTKKYEEFCKKIKEILKDNVENVVISNRLVESPCCLVSSDFGWSANMERIMKAQALNVNNMNSYMKSRKIFELNIEHSIIKNLYKQYEDNNIDTKFNRLINIIYDTCALASGFSIDDPKLYSNVMYDLIQTNLSFETDTKETDTKETDTKETEPKETEPKETETKETETKETETEETKTEETENKETDTKETETKETETEETEPKETKKDMEEDYKNMEKVD